MSKELADALNVDPAPPEVRERYHELMQKTDSLVTPKNREEVITAARRNEPVTYEVTSWEDLWTHWQPRTPSLDGTTKDRQPEEE